MIYTVHAKTTRMKLSTFWWTVVASLFSRIHSKRLLVGYSWSNGYTEHVHKPTVFASKVCVGHVTVLDHKKPNTCVEKISEWCLLCTLKRHGGNLVHFWEKKFSSLKCYANKCKFLWIWLLQHSLSIKWHQYRHLPFNLTPVPPVHLCFAKNCGTMHESCTARTSWQPHRCPKNVLRGWISRKSLTEIKQLLQLLCFSDNYFPTEQYAFSQQMSIWFRKRLDMSGNSIWEKMRKLFEQNFIWSTKANCKKVQAKRELHKKQW